MRHLTLIPTLAICTSVVAYAQGQTQSFSGQVLDEAGKPLGYATVAMLRADSTLIARGTTDADGHFALSSEEAVSLLRISSVGYEQAYLDAHAFASPIRLRPTAVQIEGVEVRAQRPQVKLMGGALVLGVQGTTLVHQPNMLGLLGQVPGLLVSQSGKVELVSKGTLLVLLNGREVHAMDEVLVYSTRTTIPLKRVSGKVEVISPKTIEQSGLRDLTSVLKQYSSVDVVQYPGFLSNVGIRGFAPDFSKSRYVAVLINGIPSGTSNLSTLGLSDIAQVEVLKGPFSSIYGTNAMGGVINVITRKSTERLSGSMSLSAGSYSSGRSTFTLGGGVTPKLSFDLGISYDAQGTEL